MPESTTPPLRGRRGRDRRLAEQVAERLRRASCPREIHRSGHGGRLRRCRGRRGGRRLPRRPRPAPTDGEASRGPGGGPGAPAATACPTCPRCHPLLAATGTFTALRERLGPRGRRGSRRVGRHVGLVVGPARGQVLPRGGARPWADRRAARLDRARRGDRRSRGRGARGVARRSGRRGHARAAHRAGLRAERAGRRRDRGARRGPRRLAQRPGAGPGGERPGPPPAHDRPGRTCPVRPRELRSGARLHQDALLRELFELGYVPVPEVAGRGEFARRGGIVDVFPPSLPLPIRDRVLRRRDRLAPRLRPDRPADGPAPSTTAVLLPASEFLLPPGGAAAIRERLGRRRGALPGAARRRPRALRGRRPTIPRRARDRGRDAGPGRRRRRRGLGRPAGAGDRPRPPRPGHARSSSTSRATSPRRPSSCGARRTSGAPS